MKKKIQILLFFFVFMNASCSVASNTSCKPKVKEIPIHNFVKVYTQLKITRCPKENKNHEKNISIKTKCETDFLYSTGSGLIVDIHPKDTVILTAGHVCLPPNKIPAEDDRYYYTLGVSMKALDSKGQSHDAVVIDASYHGPESGDLCSLIAPSLNNRKDLQKIKISKEAPQVGEEIYFLGAPSGIYHPPTVPIIKGIFNGPIDKTSSLITAHAGPGASGSVILSVDNKIYGVLFAVHPSYNSATVITSFQTTKKFILKTRKLIEIMNL